MAVSNPASFSSIRAEFGGSTKFSDYYRGGPYVPLNAAASISTTAVGLALSQFNGVSKPSAALAASGSASTLSSFGSSKGTYTIGTCTVTASGGTGSYTYGTATLYSGTSSDDVSNINCSQSTNAYTYKAVNVMPGPGTGISGVWRMPVSDGVSTVYVYVTVNWN